MTRHTPDPITGSLAGGTSVDVPTPQRSRRRASRGKGKGKGKSVASNLGPSGAPPDVVLVVDDVVLVVEGAEYAQVS
jgi:hypothetical protein